MFTDKYSNIYCKFYCIDEDTLIPEIIKNLTKYHATFIPIRSDYISDFDKIKINQIEFYIKKYVKNTRRKYKRILKIKKKIGKKEQNNITSIMKNPFIKMIINPITKINISNTKQIVFDPNIRTIQDIDINELTEFKNKCDQLLQFILDRYKLKTIMSFIIYNKTLMRNNNKIIARVILENKKDKNIPNLLSKIELPDIFNSELFRIFFNKNREKTEKRFYFKTL